MSHYGVYKIIDLGFARMMPSDESLIAATVLGTLATMAP
jgi:serine/threonine protein kinase